MRASDVRPSAGRKARGLGLWMCTALVIGNMVGSGIFLLPASLARFGGISILGWLFTASGAILLALVFARLARMVPGAGGPYAYSRAGFGDFAGFLIAWGYWISTIAGNAAIAVAFIGYLGFFWPAVARSPLLGAVVATTAIWLLVLVNAAGVRKAGSVAVVTTVLKLLPLLAVGVVGLFFLSLDSFRPFNASGGSAGSAITACAALTLWAFLGLESSTIPADDVQRPRVTIPRATILGTGLTAAVYILGTVAVMGLIPLAELGQSTAPFADAAQAMFGGWAGYLIAGGAVISTFGALNGWTLILGQVPAAAARDGLFPAIFARPSRAGTPAAGMVISSVLVTILMLMNFSRGLVAMFTFIILLATLCTLIPYAFCAMAELMVFVKQREQFRGERLAGATVIAALAFVYSLWAIAGSGQESVYWGLMLLLAGIPFYVWLRWRAARDADSTAS